VVSREERLARFLLEGLVVNPRSAGLAVAELVPALADVAYDGVPDSLRRAAGVSECHEEIRLVRAEPLAEDNRQVVEGSDAEILAVGAYAQPSGMDVEEKFHQRGHSRTSTPPSSGPEDGGAGASEAVAGRSVILRSSPFHPG
jgi:hypothetical protein